MSVGDVIREARKNKGYTQEELGNILGVKKATISKYELGQIQNVKRTNLKKLAQVLDIEPHQLIDDFKNPIEKATEVADVMLDDELMSMIREYNSLDKDRQAKVREYVHLQTLA